MIVIGVTGSVGTGKSTVSRMFRDLGARLLDADKLSRSAVRQGKPAWREVVSAFGPSVLHPDGRLNRKRLAAVVFQDKVKRKQLERIIHPRVMRAIQQQLMRWSRLGKVRAAVCDVPLLIEAGVPRFVDALVVVTAPYPVQRQRLMKRYGWSEQEIRSRINAQKELSAKAELADYVVDNSDGLGATRIQVKEIWTQLVAAQHRPNRRNSTSQR